MPDLLSTSKEVGQKSAAESGSPNQSSEEIPKKKRKTSTVAVVLLLRCQTVYPIHSNPVFATFFTACHRFGSGASDVTAEQGATSLGPGCGRYVERNFMKLITVFVSSWINVLISYFPWSQQVG